MRDWTILGKHSPFPYANDGQSSEMTGSQTLFCPVIGKYVNDIVKWSSAPRRVFNLPRESRKGGRKKQDPLKKGFKIGLIKSCESLSRQYISFFIILLWLDVAKLPGYNVKFPMIKIPNLLIIPV